MEHEAVPPLVEARSRIEQQMNELREKLVVLSKKREAIQTAIDVLRSSDAELKDVHLQERKQRRVLRFDEDQIEEAVKDTIRQGGPKSRPEISALLTKSGFVFSEAGLLRILRTSPAINKSGERDRTRYSLNGA